MGYTIIIPNGANSGSSAASTLKDATGVVDVSAATAPSTGQVLTATDATHATWQPAAGGAPTGAAGGDLGGTYPNPTVAKAAALKSATTTVDVSAATAPTASQVLTATDSTHATWVTPVASTLKSASTSIDIAAATAPSAGQVLTATDSTHATWVTSSATPPRVHEFVANADICGWSIGSTKAQTALKPNFYPIIPKTPTASIQGCKVYINTLLAASTVGVALYSIAYSGAGAFTATKVTALTTALSGAAVGIVSADFPSAPIALDFTANDYVVGVVTSDAGTMKLNGSANVYGSGAFMYNTPLADCTGPSFPASFTNSAILAPGTATIAFAVMLYTATGKNYV